MHTPGPWEARPAEGHVVLNGSSIYAVRDIPSDRYNPDDIRLIAAAPALLSALIDAADELGSISQTAGTDSVLEAARKAIELATGDAYAQR